MSKLTFTAAVPEYKAALADLIYTINAGGLEVNKKVNRLYWSIGETIAKKQEQYGWGASVIDSFSRDLKKYFNVKKGFSSRSLIDMRLVYLSYRDVIDKGGVSSTLCK